MNSKNGQLMGFFVVVFFSGEEVWLLCENYIKPLETEISRAGSRIHIYKKQGEDNGEDNTAVLLL